MKPSYRTTCVRRVKSWKKLREGRTFAGTLFFTQPKLYLGTRFCPFVVSIQCILRSVTIPLLLTMYDWTGTVNYSTWCCRFCLHMMRASQVMEAKRLLSLHLIVIQNLHRNFLGCDWRTVYRCHQLATFGFISSILKPNLDLGFG